MGKQYDLVPREVPIISTEYRNISTQIPVPDSIELFKDLQQGEPASMSGMPPIIWDKAEDFSIYDKWGNKWIDFTSAVLISNVGHSNEKILAAIKNQIDRGLLTTYLFANESRMELVKKLNSILPNPLSKTYLLSTGTETVECAIKLARTYGARKSNGKRIKIIS